MALPHARIIGTGSYLPAQCLTNHDLARMVETSDEWIKSRSGIVERHIAAPDEATSDLAAQAARAAMSAAGVTIDDIDMILVATTSPDMLFPSTAIIVQKKLGGERRQIPAMDLQAVCSGFIYGLSVAEKFIITGACQRVLVIGAEIFSRIVDWKDRTTCILFGDGAGAVVVARAEEGEPGILSTHIHADGSYVDLLKMSGGITARPPQDAMAMAQGIGYVTMRGNEVYKKAVTVLGDVVEQTLAHHGLDKSAIDWLVPHQANVRIIESTAKRLDMDMGRVVVTVDRHGNTSAASIPLALDEAVRDGRIQPGHLVLLEAFGAGFTWGSALVRW